MSDSFPAPLQSLKTGLATASQRLRSTLGTADFIKINKGGVWQAGSDGYKIDTDVALFAIDPARFRAGYVSWETDESKGSAKLGEEMVLMTDPPIDVHSLPNTGCKWVEQLAMDMVCVKGAHKGSGFIFNTTSVGGKRALSGLVDTVVMRMNDAEDDTFIPVIALGSSSYKHRQYGEIFHPVFDVKEWVSYGAVPQPAEEEQEFEEEDDPEFEPAPRRRRRRGS